MKILLTNATVATWNDDYKNYNVEKVDFCLFLSMLDNEKKIEILKAKMHLEDAITAYLEEKNEK